MKLDLEEILKQVLPLIQESHQDSAKQMITDRLEKPSLLQTIINLITGKQSFDLATLLPSLLAMVKPENVADIKNVFEKLPANAETKKKRKAPAAKAKPTATKAKPSTAAKPKPAETTPGPAAKPKPATKPGPAAKPKPATKPGPAGRPKQ